jgi:hypothetical protein
MASEGSCGVAGLQLNYELHDGYGYELHDRDKLHNRYDHGSEQ